MSRAVGRRVPVSPASGTDRVGYLRGVWEELKKVIWPSPSELWRMTGIVVATVIIFAAFIGGADYALGLVVKQLYTTSSNNTVNLPANTTTPLSPAPAPVSTAPSQPTVSP